MNPIKSLILKFRAKQIGIGLEPMPDSMVPPKTLLVENARGYIMKVTDKGLRSDPKALAEAVGFLEDFYENWETYTEDVETYDRKDMALSIAYGLADYYRWANKMTASRTAEYMEKDLLRRAG